MNNLPLLSLHMKLSKYFFTGITRNIIILGLVSMLTDLSSQIIFPLIPLFLTSLGAGASIVGIVEGAAETTASFLKVLSGYFSDRFKKRKLFIFIGYAISTITKPLFALTKTRPLVLLFRVIERIGKGVRDAPRDALIAESTETKYLGKSFGLQRSMDGLGSVLGAIIALIIFPILWYQKTFLFAALPGILAVLAILFVKEGRKYKVEGPKSIKSIKSDEKTLWHSTLRPSTWWPYKLGLIEWLKLLPRHLILFIITATVFTLGNFGYAFLLLKTKAIGLTDYNAIFFYVLFYGVYTLCSIPAGMLADRFGKKTILQIGYGLFIPLSLGLIFVSSQLGILLFFVLYGIFFALIDGTQRAVVAELSPAEYKATALGVFHTAVGIVALPAGFLMWFLRDKRGPSSTFLYASIIGIIAFVMLIAVRREKATG